MSFKDALRELIGLRDLSQAEVARRMDVSQATVNAWAMGNKRPEYPNALTLEEVLDVQPRGRFLALPQKPALTSGDAQLVSHPCEPRGGARDDAPLAVCRPAARAAPNPLALAEPRGGDKPPGRARRRGGGFHLTRPGNR